MLKQTIYLFFDFLFFSLPAVLLSGKVSARVTDTGAIYQLIRQGTFQANPDSAILGLKLATQKSIQADYPLGAAKALFAMASRYSNIGNYTEALSYATQALSYAEKSGDNAITGSCYNMFGVLFMVKGDYVAASESFFAALENMKIIDRCNAGTVITLYINLANVSHLMGEKNGVLLYLDKAEALARSTTTPPEVPGLYIASIVINKGNFYAENNQPDSARICYQEVLDIARQLGPGMEGERQHFEALADINLGGLAQQAGENEKAVSYCRQGISLARGKYSGIVEDGSYTLGEALRQLKRYKEAETVLVSALAERTGTNPKAQAVFGFAALANLYDETKQYKKASECKDSLLALKDTLVTAAKAEAIKQVEAKYNMADKDRHIARNELVIAQQKNKITRKNIWIGSISSGVILFTLISIGIYRNSRMKQAGIIKSLKQENTINILKGVVQGEENERIRLARDLHDGIGGMLSATKMRFMALRHVHHDLVQSPKYLEAMGLLDIMGDEIRKTSHNLMPETLLKQDLADALRTYCNNLQAGTALSIDFQSYGSFGDLASDLKLNIYRIIQELLKNTLQHAAATYCVVQLLMTEDYLTITVEDNGIGFITTETKDGIGLHNLKTRVLSHEGHYTVKSKKGKGTTVCIEFEMKNLAPKPESAGA